MGVYTEVKVMLALAGLAILNTSEASYDGEFAYLGYSRGFHWSAQNDGETKEIRTDYGQINISSNTFSAMFNESVMSRTITNTYINGPEYECNNGYAVSFNRGAEPGIGTLEPADHKVLNIYPGDEPDMNIPLFFSRNTNVALNIEGTSSNMTHELGFGLVVRKADDMDDSMANGRYIRYTLGNTAYVRPEPAVADTLSLETALLEFDGAGSYSEQASEWSVDRLIGETNLLFSGDDSFSHTYCLLMPEETGQSSTNGTYSILPDGTMLISSDLGFITNQISPDGNLAASTLAMYYPPFAGTFLTAVVKQPENMPTNAIDAVFFLAEFSEDFSSTSETNGVNKDEISLGKTYVFLNQDGTFSMRSDYWNVENILSNNWLDGDPGAGVNVIGETTFQTTDHERTVEFQSGSYTIATNGVITLMFSDGETGQGQLSENGEYFVFGFSYSDNISEAEVVMGVGIRRDPPTPPAFQPHFIGTSMSPTGLVITAAMPAGYAFEGLFTENLGDGTWYSSGVYTSQTDVIEFTDPEVFESSSGFYNSTFAPW